MSNKGSQSSLQNATRSRAKFSGHQGSKGAAGVRRRANNAANTTELNVPGQSVAVSPPKGKPFDSIEVGATWDNVAVSQGGFFNKLMKRVTMQGVDLDLGCLYELQNGKRGCIQAFGEQYGNFNSEPHIRLSGDDRTGNREGYDEYIQINSAHWNDIKRVLFYIYIYDGASDWAKVNPQIMLDIPGEKDLVVTLAEHHNALSLCAIGGLENVRGGLKLTNYTEYFPGHAEMDRAFGFGLEWGDGTGQKRN